MHIQGHRLAADPEHVPEIDRLREQRQGVLLVGYKHVIFGLWTRGEAEPKSFFQPVPGRYTEQNADQQRVLLCNEH